MACRRAGAQLDAKGVNNYVLGAEEKPSITADRAMSVNAPWPDPGFTRAMAMMPPDYDLVSKSQARAA